eukprot:Plantae.Rhodophyta-Hildenbrandia_rubra.ctg33983.p1 GENE.Plantae.Rhodophyta-Hildenbrandia_rubra.ctg33983~~Plantae.Rhodophyta-Hildenbrandia_rubra.ctg33983.p1  ORF type:complete len:564 (+),score=82.93 Plantae.Rhodophyta-Hildenbrandia_rubra.ctg33983:589-2280(+)
MTILLLVLHLLLLTSLSTAASKILSVDQHFDASSTQLSIPGNVTRVESQSSDGCFPTSPGGVIFTSDSAKCPCYLSYMLTSFVRKPSTAADFLLLTEENYQAYKESDYKSKPKYETKYSEFGKNAGNFSLSQSVYFYRSEAMEINDNGEYRVVVRSASDSGEEDCASAVSVILDSTVKQCSSLIKDPGQQRIVGGNAVTSDRIKKNMVFYSNGMGNCTGSLVADRWVLTVAHCSVSRVSSVKVGGAIADLGEVYDVVDRISHPTFTSSDGIPGSYADIALMKLSKPVVGAKPFKINSNKDFDSGIARALGYGRIANNWRGGVGRLLQVDLPIVPFKECVEKHRKQGTALTDILNEKMHICAGRDAAQGECDACHGDSGGSLLGLNSATGEYYQIGVVSMGDECGVPGRPGIYTRVSSYQEWIRSTTEGEVLTLAGVPEAPSPGGSQSTGVTAGGGGDDGTSGATGGEVGAATGSTSPSSASSEPRRDGVVLPVWGIVLISLAAAFSVIIAAGFIIGFWRKRSANQASALSGRRTSSVSRNRRQVADEAILSPRTSSVSPQEQV